MDLTQPRPGAKEAESQKVNMVFLGQESRLKDLLTLVAITSLTTSPLSTVLSYLSYVSPVPPRVLNQGSLSVDGLQQDYRLSEILSTITHESIDVQCFLRERVPDFLNYYHSLLYHKLKRQLKAHFLCQGFIFFLVLLIRPVKMTLSSSQINVTQFPFIKYL